MAAAPRTGAATPRSLTITQRLALRMLHTGALFEGARGWWTCRSFPHQPVRAETVRCLIERGLAVIEIHAGLNGIEHTVAVLSEAGRQEPLGQPAWPANAPPAAAETVIHAVEQVMGEMERRESRLTEILASLDAEARATREAAAKIEQRMKAIEAKARTFDHERATLSSCRADMRAVATQACEQLGTTLAEFRR